MRPFLRLVGAIAITALFCAACGGDDSLFAPVPQSDAGSDATASKGGAGGTAGIGGSGGVSGSGGALQGGSAGTGGGSQGGHAGSGGVAQGGSAGQGGKGGASGTGGTAGIGGTAGAAGCAKGCDDFIACSIDSCVAGACQHAPGNCPPGQYCDVLVGCTSSPVCSSEDQCKALWGSDPCKTNVHCDTATATCKFDLLDKDTDAHAPLVCGGDDCDDSDPQKHGGLVESCDGKDNDCDGAIDQNALCPGLEVCQSGTCSCLPANLCGSECVNPNSDPNHCGTCFHKCPVSAACSNGVCDCPGSQMQCGSACIDTQSNPQHCGLCNHSCSNLESCINGTCSCTKTLCSGKCVDTQIDGSNCGTCGKVCPVGATCQTGACVCPASIPNVCGGNCVNTQTDGDNCGSCGTHCSSGPCKGGICQTCQPGGMLILLDQSGSMYGTPFSNMIAAVTSFVQEADSAGLYVGVSFYPRESSTSTVLCEADDYSTPDVALGLLPGHASTIVNSFLGHDANNASVIAPVVEGSISAVYTWRVANPGRLGTVVMISDGGLGNGCSTDTPTWATSAASAGYSGTPSVVTNIIGTGSAAATDLSTLNSIASAGGGALYNATTSGTTTVLNALRAIRATLLCP